jgi:hypothetical protein
MRHFADLVAAVSSRVPEVHRAGCSYPIPEHRIVSHRASEARKFHSSFRNTGTRRRLLPARGRGPARRFMAATKATLVTPRPRAGPGDGIAIPCAFWRGTAGGWLCWVSAAGVEAHLDEASLCEEHSRSGDSCCTGGREAQTRGRNRAPRGPVQRLPNAAKTRPHNTPSYSLCTSSKLCSVSGPHPRSCSPAPPPAPCSRAEQAPPQLATSAGVQLALGRGMGCIAPGMTHWCCALGWWRGAHPPTRHTASCAKTGYLDGI